MISTIRQAWLATELDPGHRSTVLLAANPYAGCTALGALAGRVLRVVLSDRRLLRTWLAASEGLVA